MTQTIPPEKKLLMRDRDILASKIEKWLDLVDPDAIPYKGKSFAETLANIVIEAVYLANKAQIDAIDRGCLTK